MAIGAVAMWADDAPSLVAREDTGELAPRQDLTCEPDESTMSESILFGDDEPGGPPTAPDAMEEWLRTNTHDLTLSDVVAVDPGQADAQHAVYEYRTEAGNTIIWWSVGPIGDSWVVGGWQACDEQSRTVMREATV